jgi:hypothetical protein
VRSEDVTYQYWNPYIALENSSAGIGVGYLGGDLPTTFDGDDNVEFRLTTHVRIGSDHGRHFLLSLNENEPLLTSGGPWVIGGGYRPGSRVRGFTGVSAGFYDGLGLAQKFEIALNESLLLDLGFRLGKAHTEFDGGASIGCRFTIPTK